MLQYSSKNHIYINGILFFCNRCTLPTLFVSDKITITLKESQHNNKMRILKQTRLTLRTARLIDHLNFGGSGRRTKTIWYAMQYDLSQYITIDIMGYNRIFGTLFMPTVCYTECASFYVYVRMFVWLCMHLGRILPCNTEKREELQMCNHAHSMEHSRPRNNSALQTNWTRVLPSLVGKRSHTHENNLANPHMAKYTSRETSKDFATEAFRGALVPIERSQTPLDPPYFAH